MATLNVLVVEEEGPDREVIDEAVCALRWAADAGPFSLGLRSIARAALDRAADAAPTAARTELSAADAVVLSPRAPMNSGLHQRLAIHTELQAVRVTGRAAGRPPQVDWMFVRPAQGRRKDGSARPPSEVIDDVIATAVEESVRRRGHMAWVASALTSDDGAWFARCTAEARTRDIELSRWTPETFAATAARDPGRFDVVVSERSPGGMLTDRAAALAGAVGVAVGWIGRRGHAYQSRFVATASRRTPAHHAVGTALLSVAMLLEYTAARYGLAQTMRQALDQAYDDLGGVPNRSGAAELAPWSMGQAVIERLEENFPLRVSW
jgi:isocitrate/isopropylmalate dehydrogenase